MSSGIFEITITNQWMRLATVDDKYVVKNTSGESVAIRFLEDGVLPDENDSICDIVIGGFNEEIRTKQNTCMWARCVLDRLAIVKLRNPSVSDPDGDLNDINNRINKLTDIVETHIKTISGNIHNVTKEDVKLGKISSIFTDTPSNINNNEYLSTTGLFTFVTNTYSHIDNKENPHDVSKQDVGLGKVNNFDIATDLEAVDTNNNSSYMTPAKTALAIETHLSTGYTIQPQLILEAPFSTRLPGWGIDDCDLPTKQIEKLTDTSIKINKGIRVSYSYMHKSHISNVLSSTHTLDIPAINGIYYIYGNLDGLSNFTDFNHTYNRPSSGMYRENITGDFYNVLTNQFFDMENVSIRRVYIGYVIVSGNIISDVINTPIGFKNTFPLTHELAPSGRFVVKNPFLCECDSTIEVNYNNLWGPTYWNDQIGIKITPTSYNSSSEFIVQCGQMGFLCQGRESGSVHGNDFYTVTSNIRTRIKLIKLF